MIIITKGHSFICQTFLPEKEKNCSNDHEWKLGANFGRDNTSSDRSPTAQWGAIKNVK